jgi:hypothetical protein
MRIWRMGSGIESKRNSRTTRMKITKTIKTITGRSRIRESRNETN